MLTYSQPLYYEAAYNFFDAKKQVDFFETLFARYSKIRVKSVLDIACGPGLQLMEFAKRGYQTAGLDSSAEMLYYLTGRGRSAGLHIETYRCDMHNFKIGAKVDFAFIMMGSLFVKSEQDLRRHLDSVASALKKGGLYFIQNQPYEYPEQTEKWKNESRGLKADVEFSRTPLDNARCMYAETVRIRINDKGKQITLENEEQRLYISPSELKEFIREKGSFEFLGWYPGGINEWFIDRSIEDSPNKDMNMLLIRRA